MAANLERLAQEFKQAGHPEVADGASALARLARKLKAPENFLTVPALNTSVAVEMQAAAAPETVKIYPEISLEEEWNRQAQNLARFFAKELKFETSEGYIATLPKFEPQPKKWEGRLDTPVLIETRISPKRQCELVGIQYVSDDLEKTDWNEILKNYTTPKVPYTSWLEDGRNNLKKKPENVRKNLGADEFGGTELEGIALYISNPKILEHHFLDLPGTSVGSFDASSLILWDGQPRLFYVWVGFAGPRFGSVVRGKQR